MASIIKTSINLDQIDKSKNELDNFGNNGPIIIEQTKEERESKSPKTYLGNVKVVWTNGSNVAVPPRDDAQGNGGFQAAGQPQKVEDDLPF
jgi:hypothetical protein